MAAGIRDKVAVIGMGCSKFGERWDCGPEELMVEAYLEAMADAGIEPTQLDAAWFSTHIDEIGTGKGGKAEGFPFRCVLLCAVPRVLCMLCVLRSSRPLAGAAWHNGARSHACTPTPPRPPHTQHGALLCVVGEGQARARLAPQARLYERRPGAGQGVRGVGPHVQGH